MTRMLNLSVNFHDFIALQRVTCERGIKLAGRMLS
jgi:hypothetical protein